MAKRMNQHASALNQNRGTFFLEVGKFVVL